ncbi:MAG: hypothetical protein H6668_20835 [Ardenticatenaceae bacterium]|nr:hypothetical protein [Ardenticatenaceae bacterium]
MAGRHCRHNRNFFPATAHPPEPEWLDPAAEVGMDEPEEKSGRSPGLNPTFIRLTATTTGSLPLENTPPPHPKSRPQKLRPCLNLRNPPHPAWATPEPVWKMHG